MLAASLETETKHKKINEEKNKERMKEEKKTNGKTRGNDHKPIP